jgi:hypothetical protein
MFGDLALARGDGRYPRLMRALGGVQLLILDDWGIDPLGVLIPAMSPGHSEIMSLAVPT